MLPFARPDVSQLEIDAVTECLRSGWLTTGKITLEFEQEFAKFVGAKHAIAVNSATSAALLILEQLKQAGYRQLLVPANTFSGPAMMAHKLGYGITLVDSEERGWAMDIDDVPNKLWTEKTVVMPTHFAGCAINLTRLRSVLPKEAVIIDDAAHAFPTVARDVSCVIGAHPASMATFFSFYATKTLSTGEGGMITTSDDYLAAELRSVRTHGFSRSVFDRYTNPATGWHYDIAGEGWKCNLTDPASAMGRAQLERAAHLRNARRDIADAYFDAFMASDRLVLPEYDTGHAWHLFTVQVPDRDAFIASMYKAGVQTSLHFIPLGQHSAWQRIIPAREDRRGTPNADRTYRHSVSLPIYSTMTPSDVKLVIDAVRHALKDQPCFTD